MEQKHRLIIGRIERLTSNFRLSTRLETEGTSTRSGLVSYSRSFSWGSKKHVMPLLVMSRHRLIGLATKKATIGKICLNTKGRVLTLPCTNMAWQPIHFPAHFGASRLSSSCLCSDVLLLQLEANTFKPNPITWGVM